jgi:hypothetical protein
METYFKYRSIKSIEGLYRLYDILDKRHLFAAKYVDLNDPIEGFFYHHGLSKTMLKKIMKGKMNFRICSLSQCATDIGMWTHYADEGRGVCIEVEPINNGDWERYDINYNFELINIQRLLRDNTNENAIKKILSSKLQWWEYEQETRFIKRAENESKECFLPVKIKGIIIGYKTEKYQESIIRSIVDGINSTRSKDEIMFVEKRKVNDLTTFDYQSKGSCLF